MLKVCALEYLITLHVFLLSIQIDTIDTKSLELV